jgi:hypothetical protein
MLGRLQMSVTEAIEDYGTLAQRVFSDANLIGGDGKFKATKLEDVIKGIIEKKTGRKDELMMDLRPGACKTYALRN